MDKNIMTLPKNMLLYSTLPLMYLTPIYIPIIPIIKIIEYITKKGINIKKLILEPIAKVKSIIPMISVTMIDNPDNIEK